MAESRALAALAAPLVFTQLAQMAIGTTDVLLLSRYSQTALAASAIGSTIYWFGWLVGAGPAFAVSPMIAHIRGERPNDRAGVRACLRVGLWAVLAVSLLLIPLLEFAGPIFRLLGQQPEVADAAGRFVAVAALGLPFSLGSRVLQNFATALGHPRIGLWVMTGTILFNFLAGWTLIFGHFGAQRLGIVGAATATAGSSVFGFICMAMFVVLNGDLKVYRGFRRMTRLSKSKLAEVFRLGMPIGVTMMFEGMLFNTMTLVMGTFGVAALAAHQIAMSCASITFMVPLGVGMASTVRVGMAAGAGDMAGARRAGVVALSVSAAFMTVCGVVMALFGAPIAALYLGAARPDDAQVIATAAMFLKAAAAFQLFDGLQVVGAQTLRGLKDARMPMLLAGGAYWLIGAPACFYLALGLRMGGLGIWIGFVICLAAAAIALCARFFRLTRRSTP